MKGQSLFNGVSRHARFLWLMLFLLVPGVAFLIYEMTPHETLWHEVAYSLVCVPLFLIWLVALLGCTLSFLIHRATARA